MLEAESVQQVEDTTVAVLENGLTLIHRQASANDIVGATCYIRVGAIAEEDGKLGATNLMAQVMPKGTKTRTADEISELIASLGASIGVGAGADYCSASLQCVAQDFDQVLELLADVLLNPTFPIDQIDLERQRVLASIRMNEDSTPAFVSKAFQRELYGTHPYGRPVEGETDTVTGLTQGDLVAIHRAGFVPSNMVLAIVGNLSYEEARRIVQRHLGEAGQPPAQILLGDPSIPARGRRIELSKVAEQGYVMLGHPTCPAGDPDEAALEVATAVLGGGMSARLFSELRDKQSLAYSVGASTSFLAQKGAFASFIGTKAETIDQAEQGLWRQIELLRDEPVPAEELQKAKNMIAGRYLRGHERNASQARYLAYWHLTGRGIGHDKQYLENIRAVTSRDVMLVANKYFLGPTTVVLRPVRAEAAAGS